MQKLTRIVTVIGISATLMASALLPGFAGATGRKNTALVLTAATVHQALHKKTGNAIVLGLASAQAWKNYEDARKRESRHHRHYTSYRYGHSRPHGHAYGHYKHGHR